MSAGSRSGRLRCSSVILEEATRDISSISGPIWRFTRRCCPAAGPPPCFESNEQAGRRESEQHPTSSQPSDHDHRPAYFLRARRDFAFFDFAACFPSAVRVFFGNRFSVCLRLAAAAAFLMFRFAALRCFDVATVDLLSHIAFSYAAVENHLCCSGRFAFRSLE